MLGSFMILYFCFILAGAYIIYRDVEDIGCDPSGAVPGAATCRFAGSDVLGAMFGMYGTVYSVPSTRMRFVRLFAAVRAQCQTHN
jgi:hypothetical protein